MCCQIGVEDTIGHQINKDLALMGIVAGGGPQTNAPTGQGGLGALNAVETVEISPSRGEPGAGTVTGPRGARLGRARKWESQRPAGMPPPPAGEPLPVFLAPQLPHLRQGKAGDT